MSTKCLQKVCDYQNEETLGHSFKSYKMLKSIKMLIYKK